MTIEFQTAYGKIPENLVSKIRNEILKLSHVNKDISRAEVLLKVEETIRPGDNKVCEIRLIGYGDELLFHSRTVNFRKSAKEAINELKKMIKKQAAPEEIFSTVEV
jgi:ribosome-associated translation inhibitor RaiA